MKTMVIEGEIYDSETGELINTVEQVEAVVVENNLPSIVCKGGTHIQVNTEQLKRELAVYLEKYDIEVTEENEKDSAKKATELNKLAGDLNKARLDLAKEIKKPADDLKTQVDELIEIIQGKRSSILEKVEVFKQKRFDTIRFLLQYKIGILYKVHSIEPEYQKADIEKLVKEDSLAKVDLTKKAEEALESMVLKCKNIQNNVKIRVLELHEKTKVLQVPLTKDDVLNIIELDDSEYEAELNKLVDYRLNLENRIKENIAKQEEQKAIEVAKEEAVKEKEEDEKQIETGVKVVEIIATFKVEVGLHVDKYKVLEKYKSELSKFSTLSSVSVK